MIYIQILANLYNFISHMYYGKTNRVFYHFSSNKSKPIPIDSILEEYIKVSNKKKKN